MPASRPWPTLNPTVILEGAREGIKDYRYLVTLERLVREKIQSKGESASSAQSYIVELKQESGA